MTKTNETNTNEDRKSVGNMFPRMLGLTFARGDFAVVAPGRETSFERRYGFMLWRFASMLAALFLLFSGQAFAEKAPSPGRGTEKSARARFEELRRLRVKQLRENPAGQAKIGSDLDVGYIDQMLGEEWKALGFPVSPECSEGEFVRRASLDIIGRIPTADETRAYLRDKAPDRRAKLVDRLLASPEYGKNWAIVWSKWMIPTNAVNNQRLNPEGLRAWLEKEFNRNRPWNEMVTELLSATGRWNENGAVNFLIANMDNGTVDLTANVTRLFLCVQTQCTQCHDHPWNEWKQEQFHGMNAFFLGTKEERVTKVDDGGRDVTDYYELSDMPYQELRDRGAFFERRNGLQVFTKPTYLDGRDLYQLVRGEHGERPIVVLDDEVEEDQPILLRQVLAKTITAEDNPYFARAIVNRLWYHYMGHSFVKNVDDFDNGQDEPTMPDLLDRLAEDFRASGHDLKMLTRWICGSKAYSLSSQRRGKDSEEAAGFFTYMMVKPLSAEQLYDSVMTLTEAHKASKSENTSRERMAFIRQFEQTFGNDELPTTAPKYQGTITQSLMLMNSPLIEQSCACVPGSYLHRLATDGKLSNEEKVNELYLSALSRHPIGSEKKEIEKMFLHAGSDGAPGVLGDVLWVLLNSAEFALNH